MIEVLFNKLINKNGKNSYFCFKFGIFNKNNLAFICKIWYNTLFIYGIIDDLSKCVGEDFVELIFSINSDDKMNKTKRKLIDALKNQLDELNQMLQIYLKEFVSRIPIQIKSNDISVLGDYYLLSFNYTNTCNTLYMMNNSASHYIHGNIETDIVLGISDDAFDNNDFIYFQKYFQRIQKRTGNEYLKWLKDPISYPSDDITLHIFGHSLDKTDKGILEYFFKNIDLNSIIIYYHNQEAYENQVINLVDMFGKDYVIENTGTGRIVFKELEKPVSISQNSATIHLETV